MINYNSQKDRWSLFEFSNQLGNVYPEKENPGPGDYDPKEPAKVQRDFKAYSESSNFASIVNWLKTPKSISPGPGRYFSPDDFDKIKETKEDLSVNLSKNQD